MRERFIESFSEAPEVDDLFRVAGFPVKLQPAASEFAVLVTGVIDAAQWRVALSLSASLSLSFSLSLSLNQLCASRRAVAKKAHMATSHEATSSYVVMPQGNTLCICISITEKWLED